MNNLNEPTINNEDVFDNVAKNKSYKNAFCTECPIKTNCETCKHGNRGKMLNIKDRVVERYNFYLQNKNTLQLIQPVNILTSDEVNLLKSAYRSSKVIQKVKQELFDNIPENRRGLCPFCMGSEATTLDHYFSESEYPEYIIFAPNLVPCCSHCNTKKGDRLFIENQRTIIHFYYDKLPQEQYLKAKFWIQDRIPQISFSLDFENKTEVTDVITRHFDILNLVARYNESSCGILSTECTTIKSCLINGWSIDQCVQLLKFRVHAMEQTYGTNYWETCIYRAMSESGEELIKLID